MWINEELKKIQEKEDPNNHAIEMYKEQLKAITNISHTDWYKEIKRYWKTVLEWIKTDYPIVKECDLHKLQEKDKIASNFLMFLNNLENAKNINKMAKQK